jgi:hypothetical protein
MAPGVKPEREETWAVEGVTIVFKIDLEQNYQNLFKITDYKTCSNLDYKKTPEYLVGEDPQGTIYPAYGFSKRPDLSTIDLEWLYLTTFDPFKCYPVRAVAEASATRERFGRMLDVSRYMLSKRHLQVHPLTLEPNPKRCRKYFGKPCPYRAYCTDLTPEKEFDLAMIELSHTNSDNLAFLATLGAASTPPAASPPPTVAPAVAAFPSPAAPFTPPGQAPGVPSVQAPPPVVQGGLPPWMTPGPSVAEPPPLMELPPVLTAAQEAPPPVVEAPKAKKGKKVKAEVQVQIDESGEPVFPELPPTKFITSELPTQVEIPRAHPTIPAPPPESDLRTAMFYELVKCFALNPAALNMAPEDVVNKAANWLTAAESAGFQCS